MGVGNCIDRAVQGGLLSSDICVREASVQTTRGERPKRGKS